MDCRADWTYMNLSEERIAHLNSCPLYCELINKLCLHCETHPIEFTLETGDKFPLIGAIRPIFYVKNTDIADWLFNGTCGYRAQYYLSPENGLNANSFAFSQMEPLLFKAAQDNNFSYTISKDKKLRISEDDLLTSLRFPSAKIWGDEKKGNLNQIVQNKISSIQIMAHRWKHFLDTDVQKAQWGVHAPLIKTLKFHGAWIKDKEEKMAIGKAGRAEEIHLYGFS